MIFFTVIPNYAHFFAVKMLEKDYFHSLRENQLTFLRPRFRYRILICLGVLSGSTFDTYIKGHFLFIYFIFLYRNITNFGLLSSYMIILKNLLLYLTPASNTFMSSVIWGNYKVLILDGNPKISAHAGRNKCYLICFRHSWLDRGQSQMGYFSPIRPIFLHVRATYYELPSDISTMGNYILLLFSERTTKM